MDRILVIEDDETLQKVYRQVLTQNGFEVATASSGRQGMGIIKQGGISLLLLDIMLPGGMNGFDVLQQLKRDSFLPSLPVIVLTNLDSEKQTAIDCGAVDYFFKAQMELSTLVEKVRHHITTPGSS